MVASQARQAELNNTSRIEYRPGGWPTAQSAARSAPSANTARVVTLCPRVSVSVADDSVTVGELAKGVRGSFHNRVNRVAVLVASRAAGSGSCCRSRHHHATQAGGSDDAGAVVRAGNVVLHSAVRAARRAEAS